MWQQGFRKAKTLTRVSMTAKRFRFSFIMSIIASSERSSVAASDFPASTQRVTIRHIMIITKINPSPCCACASATLRHAITMNQRAIRAKKKNVLGLDYGGLTFRVFRLISGFNGFFKRDYCRWRHAGALAARLRLGGFWVRQLPKPHRKCTMRH